MLNKKAYLVVQAFLASIFTKVLNDLCSLCEFTVEYENFNPAISVFIAYLLIIFFARFSFKSLDEIRYENAKNNYLKTIKKQLVMNNLSDEKRNELEKLQNDILLKDLDLNKLYFENCQNNLEKNLKE